MIDTSRMLNDHVRVLTRVSLSPAVIRAAKGHSRKYAGCPRPVEGSLSHYCWIAVLEKLRRDGLDVERAGWCEIPKRINDLDMAVSPNG